MSTRGVPEALLLIGPACPHCAALLEVLSGLVKTGAIASLEVVNVAQRPERASELGVRSVPWLRLGEIELSGAHTEGEIKHWLTRLQSPEGKSDYLRDLLQSGELDKVIHLARGNTKNLQALLHLAARDELDIKVQLGISAVFEELQGAKELQSVVPDIGAMASSTNVRVRADAAHFLSLTDSAEAIPFLQQLAADSHAEVKDIATEALNELARP